LKSVVVFLTLALAAPQVATAGENRCSGNFCYQARARTGCFQPKMWNVLNRVAERIGPLEITSGCDGRHSRNSFHYRGMAVDFRPMRVSQGAAMAALRADPEVGGAIAEGRGLVHADIGDRGQGKYVAYQRGARRYAAAGSYGRKRFVRVAMR
jgi:hypothetical protein